MRDRRVAPVEHAQLLALRVDVLHVEVVVLNRFRDVVRGQFGAQLCEARCECMQPIALLALEWQLTLQ